MNFDLLPVPEPSSLVGFSQNRLIRDAENRSEDTIRNALQNPASRFYLFAKGRVLLTKLDAAKVLFEAGEIEAFNPRMEQAILLGDASDGPRIAVPCSFEPDNLEEPWTSYDLRSLLYSGSVGDEDAGAIAQASSMLYWNATNRFCGRCGTKSESRIGGYRRDCPECGSKIFPRTDPVVIMLPIMVIGVLWGDLRTFLKAGIPPWRVSLNRAKRSRMRFAGKPLKKAASR